jgi:hypothetical protein
MRVLLSLLTLFSFNSLVFAQGDPKITEQIRQNSRGSFNAFVLEMPGTISSLKSVKSDLGSFLKAYKGKTSYNKKADEYLSDDAKIKAMSENTVDIYAKVVPKDAETLELVVWYNMGVVYLSSSEYPQGVAAAQTMLLDFSDRESVNMLKEQLDAEEKKLKEMNSGVKSLKKEAEGYVKSVNDYKEAIQKIEQKIAEIKEKEATNTKEQAKQKADVQEQEKKIEGLKKEIKNMKKR